MNNIKIVNYEDKYKDAFRDLSYEWLEKYASVEPEDEKILNNPREVILDKGGYIFLAQDGDDCVGTVALIKVDDNTFELAKLAVTERYKGQGIGNLLMDKCMEIAEIEKIKQMILYTGTFLIPAVNLDKKYGFKEVVLEDNKYIESDLKMERYF